MSKRDLKVGTKVRFVGPALKNDGSNTPFWNRMDQTGVVQEQIGDIVIFIDGYEIHRRQVTHILKKKPKEREKRREYWANIPRSGPDNFKVFKSPVAAYDYLEKIEDTVHLVELRPGEIPLTREALAKAWDSVVAASAYCNVRESSHAEAHHFKAFCTALGFNKQGE